MGEDKAKLRSQLKSKNQEITELNNQIVFLSESVW